MSQTSFFLFI